MSGKVTARKRTRPPTEADKLRDLIAALNHRPMEATHIIDFGLLDELGVLAEFTRLTSRLGISHDFWEIPAQRRTYKELTAEFLATLVLETQADDSHEITFRLLNRSYRVSLATLIEVFHLQPPQTDYLDYVPENYVFGEDESRAALDLRAAFWPQITGVNLPDARPDPRVNAIIHPVLRIICRYFGNSIYARGESTLRPRHDELALLATMLRPDDQLRRPNIMLLMIRFWLTLVRPARDTGYIQIGAYVTHIAHHVGIDFSHPQGQIGNRLVGYQHPFDPARTLNRELYRQWKWLVPEEGTTQKPPRLVWKISEQWTLPLPLQIQPLEFDSPSTWLLQTLPQSPPPSPPQAFDWAPNSPIPHSPYSHPMNWSPWPGATHTTPLWHDRSAGGAGWSAGGAGWSAGGGGWSADGAGTSAGAAGPFAGGGQQDAWSQMFSNVRQTHSWMQEAHGWMRETHGWMRDTNARVDAISTTQTEIRDRQNEMHDLIRAMHAAQLGEGAGGPPDDTDMQ